MLGGKRVRFTEHFLPCQGGEIVSQDLCVAYERNAQLQLQKAAYASGEAGGPMANTVAGLSHFSESGEMQQPSGTLPQVVGERARGRSWPLLGAIVKLHAALRTRRATSASTLASVAILLRYGLAS
jgi:hypothetical protein